MTINTFGPNNSTGAFFDGAALNAYTGNNGANSILSTAGIEGAGTRSVEVWAYNPSVNNEETLVSWARRGGPNGTHVAMGYGSNQGFGAVAQWGPPDIGWNGTPPVGEWHHLVYTWDGVRTRVYEDGMLKHLEASTPINNNPVLNTQAGFAINIGVQNTGGQPAPGVLDMGAQLRYSGAIGKVRIHDGVLTDAQVLNNFNEDAASYGQTQLYPIQPVPVAQPLGAGNGPVHRYSFTSDASDSVGGAHGAVVDAGTTTNAVQAEVGTLPLRASFSLAGLQDLNNWLGRAQWPDPLFDGLFNEFRIYDYALNANQILGNFQTGPDIVNIPEPASVLLVLVGAGCLLGRRRRAG